MYFKGIVMDLNQRYAIVMKDNGSMVKINIKDGLEVGMCIFFVKEDIYSCEKGVIKEKNNKWLMPVVSVAVMAILFIYPLMIMKEFNNIYAILTIDINPSIELNIDKKKRIVKVNELNEDAYKVDIDKLKGLSLEEGIGLLKEMILKSEDINNKDCVLVGFSFLENIEDSDFEEDIQNTIEGSFDDFNIVYLKGTEEEFNNAKLRSTSLGRYTINEKFKNKLSKETLKSINVSNLIELFEKHLDESEVCEIEIFENIDNELEDESEKDVYESENKINEEYRDDLKEEDDDKSEVNEAEEGVYDLNIQDKNNNNTSLQEDIKENIEDDNDKEDDENEEDYDEDDDIEKLDDD